MGSSLSSPFYVPNEKTLAVESVRLYGLNRKLINIINPLPGDRAVRSYAVIRRDRNSPRGTLLPAPLNCQKALG